MNKTCDNCQLIFSCEQEMFVMCAHYDGTKRQKSYCKECSHNKECQIKSKLTCTYFMEKE